jgi:predicted Zn-dependent protease
VRLLAFLFLCLLPAVARTDTLPSLGDPSQTVLSPAQERQLGESIMVQIRAARQYLDEPEISDYINGLGYRLVAVSPSAQQPFEFFVIDDPTLNAFALPGGFIGVHTGLIRAAESESEVASVLGHEVAHVTQRHIARLFQQQQQAGLASLAAIALAVLAARSSPDLAAAAMAGAQYATLQTRLNFTRDNEREADRIGVQILERSGFDPRAMPVFFDRMQRAFQVYESNAPAYMRTHPLTYERIADVQGRVDALPYRQVPDSLEFQLLRARLQQEQYSPREAVAHFDAILEDRRTISESAARYALVTALLRAQDFKRAVAEVQRLQGDEPNSAMVATLVGRTRARAGDTSGALQSYGEAIKRFPRYRALYYDQARLLLDARRPQEALQVLAEVMRFSRPDARLYSMQAEAYARVGQKLQQHRAQAEAYLLRGSLPAAIEQLQMGLRAGDGDYYQQSSAEARLRELRRTEADLRKPR